MEFNNYLIDEKFLRNKEDELYCIEFLDNGEFPVLVIDTGINEEKNYEFIISSYKEQFYENDKTLLTFFLPLNIKKGDKILEFKNNFIKFLRRWYYGKGSYVLKLNNLKNDPDYDIFKNIVPLTKNNFFFEGIKDNLVIFRILLNHN